MHVALCTRVAKTVACKRKVHVYCAKCTLIRNSYQREYTEVVY